MSAATEGQPLTASTAVAPAAPQSPDAVDEPAGTAAALIDDAPATPAETAVETPRGRSRRHAHRARLYFYAIVAVALSAVVVALAASNTAHTKVSWVIGSSHVSLVWMVLAAVVLGWLLGILTAAALHRRTRAPH
jgi:uncharacterized integral membrane protein